MRVERMGAGLLLAVGLGFGAIVAAARGGVMPALAAVGVVMTALVFTSTVLSPRVALRAVAAVATRQRLSAFELEKALYALVVTGTALILIAIGYAVVGFARSASLGAILAGPAAALLVRFALIEPLKANVEARLSAARRAADVHGLSQ